MNEIILIGNPNSGKTTLFNTLTKSNERVSNWHGVTVSVKSKELMFDDEKYLLTDVPGVYSLNGYSNEEKIACEYLNKHRESLIINICDANNLRRALKLTMELINNGLNVIVAVNMCQEIDGVDYCKLGEGLRVQFIEIDARTRKGVLNLKSAIKQNFHCKKPQKTHKNIKNDINIEYVLNKLAKNKQNNRYKISDKIDKIVLSRYIFIPLFLITVFSVFYFTFGTIGNAISNVFIHIFNNIANKMQKIILCVNIKYEIKFLICDGILNSFLSVISFLPQVAILMFFFNILEDTGVMSRFAYMFDGYLKKVGLTGKSLFSLFLGYGCTTSAVITTRNLENKNLRKRTAMLLPFIPCNAKLPVFLVIASLFFDKYKYLYVFLLYLFSLILIVVYAFVLKKIIPPANDLFILEMPKYRFPKLKKIFFDVWVVVKDFVIKVGTLILFFGALVWVLQNISIDLRFLNGKNFEQSLLFTFSSLISPPFKFIGLDNVGVVCALILGLVAKELIVVGLAVINGVGGSLSLLSQSLISTSSVCSFTPVSSIVFLIFILIYSPCISALATLKNELGMKLAIGVCLLQIIFAYVVSFVVYKLLSVFSFETLIACFFVVDILVLFVLKLKKKKQCRGDCYECGKILCR